MHAVTVMGVAGVMTDDAWSMTSCKTCKKKVDVDNKQCSTHPDDDVEERVLLHFDLVDETGSCKAVAYQEVLSFCLSCTTTTMTRRRHKRLFDSASTAVGIEVCVVRQDNSREADDSESKYMTPTISAAGVVETWPTQPIPTVGSSAACPVVYCSEVTYQTDLGLARVRDQAVHAVRRLICLDAAGSEDESAHPDQQAVGLCVARSGGCALNIQDKEKYNFEVAGSASSVQWLVSAPGDST